MDLKFELLKQEINNSILKSENNIKSEINKLIIWIVGIVFASGALFIAVTKLLFK